MKVHIIVCLLLFTCSTEAARKHRKATKSPLKTIPIDKCRDHEWFNKNYIVYLCTAKENGERELRPFGCDPSNGVSTNMRKPPLFPGREYIGNGFVYGCVENKENETFAYKAISCIDRGRRFAAGSSQQTFHGNTLHCYEDQDGILRLKVTGNVHNKCHPWDSHDPNCKVGKTETVINSAYGTGEGYSYNAQNKELTGNAQKKYEKLANDAPRLGYAKQPTKRSSANDDSKAHFERLMGFIQERVANGAPSPKFSKTKTPVIA